MLFLNAPEEEITLFSKVLGTKGSHSIEKIMLF